MFAPNITTAIPKRRYQLGNYSIVILGEIESSDAQQYLFIMAAIREEENQPTMYVISQKTSEPDGSKTPCLRLVNELMDEILDCDPVWGELESFTDKALELAKGNLGLTDSSLHKLL
jgi:hypothetical protein